MTESHRVLDGYAHPVTERTAPIELVRAAVSFGLRTGLDANQILEDAEVSPMLLAEGRSRVTEGQVTRIVQGLWRQTDDEMFGLGPLPLPRGSFRMLCYGILSAPTLGGALERLAGFAGAMPALPPVRLSVTGDTARVTLGLPTVDDPEGLVATMGLVVVHRFMSWAIGQPVPLTWVRLPNDGPLGPETHRMLFGSPVELRAETAALEFPSSIVSAPIVRNEAELEAFVAASPAGLLSRPERDATTADQVRRIFEHGLKASAMPGADDVAQRLAMSGQTLRRKLAEEGTSVRDLREDLLRDAAVTSLVKGDESVADLSERLGFSEPSAFTRAFRRWTGSTPGSYRRGGDEA
jgi:AraC-like DNA-binding protein